jgi:hypothetical protein
VDGGDDALQRVVKEDRNTVGRSYSDGDFREIRDKSIESFQFLPGHPGSVDDGDSGSMHLMPLYDCEGQLRLSSRRERLDAGAQGIMEEILIHGAKIRII